MPFAPLLRTGLLLSSLGVAFTYTLYEQNPAFRAFVDRTLDQIGQVWDDILKYMTPEERQQEREHQRGLLLEALAGRDTSAAAAQGPTATAAATGSDTQDARARRRRLWETAEANAAEIRSRAATRGRSARSGLQNQASSRQSMQQGETLFSADAPSEPSTGASKIAAGLFQPSQPQTSEEAMHIPPRSSSLAVDIPDTASKTPSITSASSSAGTEDGYSNILTPTSPALHSVSGSDSFSDVDADAPADPPISHIDPLSAAMDQAALIEEDPPVSDIDSLAAGTSTLSLGSTQEQDQGHDGSAERDDVISLASGTSGFSDAGEDTNSVGSAAEQSESEWGQVARHPFLVGGHDGRPRL